MKELSKEEMKKIFGGQSNESPEPGGDDFGCPSHDGLSCTTTQECRDVNAGDCHTCNDGTKHCG